MSESCGTPSLLQSFTERLSRVKFSMANAFRHLADVVQGVTLSQNEPVWLLGTFYGIHNHDTGVDSLGPEAAEGFLRDFKSRIWITYRTGFPPLDIGAGSAGLTTDVGWGCTLRSGQMLLAEVGTPHHTQYTMRSHLHKHSGRKALMRHIKGRTFSIIPGDASPDKALIDVLALFSDTTSAPLSLHSICSAGAQHGVVPGKWLGPWVLCKALEGRVNSLEPHGLKVHVVCDPGGGAPALDVQQVRDAVFGAAAEAAAATTLGGTTPGCKGVGQAQGEGASHGARPDPGAGTAVEGLRQVMEAQLASQEGVEPGVGDQECVGKVQEGCGEQERHQTGDSRGLLLLLPLTLGVGKANPLYFPQLLQVLSFPHSVGIIGGRPASSLLFIGHQTDNLVYLDPHEPQPAATLPASLPSYSCPTPRIMPITAMDPSLAIGFYCASPEDFDDLAQRLAALAHQHRKAPLVTIACGGAGTDRAHDPLAFDDDLDAASDEGSGSLVSNWDGDGRQGEGGDVAASSGVPAGSGLRSKGSRRHEDWELV